MELGTVLRVHYDAWADGLLFDTTSAETAKANDLHHENVYYGPLAIIVGAGRVPAGFDKALLSAKAGQEGDVEIPPEEGFGKRDPAKVEVVALREFHKRKVEPEPGMRVQWEGKGRGTVISMTASRVRVDFNPPLAGKTLRYKFNVVEVVEEPAARVRAVLEADYAPGRGADFQVQVTEGVAEVVVPDACKFDPRWIERKYLVVADLRRFAGIQRIRFVEEYEPPATPPAPESTVAEERAEGGAPDATVAEEELTEADRAEVERELAARRRV